MPLHVRVLEPYERLKPECDCMNEECGVFGIYTNQSGIDAAEAAYYGLFSLQHRALLYSAAWRAGGVMPKSSGKCVSALRTG